MKTKKRATPVDGVVKMSAEFTSSTGEEDVISLHALAQETADGNGTTVDNGASSANGGAVYLHVTEMTTALAVTVRHSTDNFVSSDVLLATFTADPAAGTAQRIALTGTINRYVRVVWDLTDDATFGAAINRR